MFACFLLLLLFLFRICFDTVLLGYRQNTVWHFNANNIKTFFLPYNCSNIGFTTYERTHKRCKWNLIMRSLYKHWQHQHQKQQQQHQANEWNVLLLNKSHVHCAFLIAFLFINESFGKSMWLLSKTFLLARDVLAFKACFRVHWMNLTSKYR